VVRLDRSSDVSEGRWRTGLHRAADRIDGRWRPALRRLPRVERSWIALLDRIVSLQSDRRYLRCTILPAIARAAPDRLLFVGVRGYTGAYAETFRSGPTEFWTTDIDPDAARYGVPDRHVIADARMLDQAVPPRSFPMVLLNGVFGWGVDEPEDMERTLGAVHAVLSRGGLLLIGWNADRAPDPEALRTIRLFEPAAPFGLPHRKRFADVTHVYAWYRACDNPAGR
jgi:hypothetical protein